MGKPKEEQKERKPDKPTKNGHYMGIDCGFDYEDGRYHVAPSHSNLMERALEERRALNLWIDAHNTYAMKRADEIANLERRFWKNVREDYGLGLDTNWSYQDGWLIPIEKSEIEHGCIYCGLRGFKGDKALIAHHGECSKNPWIKSREDSHHG